MIMCASVSGYLTFVWLSPPYVTFSSAPRSAPSASPARSNCRICPARLCTSDAETGATAGVREEVSKLAEESGSRRSMLMVRQLMVEAIVWDSGRWLLVVPGGRKGLHVVVYGPTGRYVALLVGEVGVADSVAMFGERHSLLRVSSCALILRDQQRPVLDEEDSVGYLVVEIDRGGGRRRGSFISTAALCYVWAS